MDETSTLDELRNLVLSKSCLHSITPADCKRISLEISNTLQKTLSETTIKRLFGFANARHKFSKFTLTALAEYVDKHPGHTAYHGAQEIDLKSASISKHTIKSTKNRSEIPYHLTISRDFAALDLENFHQSSCSFNCLISPPGYGRSILLSRLAEQIMDKQHPCHNNTSLLFISARHLFENEEKQISFEEQVKSLLDIHPEESLLHYAEVNQQQSGKIFTLFLDGFCELGLKNKFKELLLESIFDFIHSLGESNSIKIVMSMRTSTWKKYEPRVLNSEFLKSKWFAGQHYDPKTSSNIPDLTKAEISQILNGIKEDSIDHPELSEEFKIPLNISLYYQLMEERSQLQKKSPINSQDLVAQYVKARIYRSNYYTEKIHFLRKIIHLSEYGKDELCVSKDLLINDLSAFKNAYIELLSDGVLTEEVCLTCKSQTSTVCFSQPAVFDYFLQIEVLTQAEKVR